MLELAVWPKPILQQETKPIMAFDGEIDFLSKQMFKTMYAHKGIGLAAPQVNFDKRMLVMDCGKPRVMLNPVIVEASEAKVKTEEGCLSFPGFLVDVERHAQVVVHYHLPEGGNFIEERLVGIEAIVAQHEIDHLDGITFLKYLSLFHRKMIQKKMEQLNKG